MEIVVNDSVNNHINNTKQENQIKTCGHEGTTVPNSTTVPKSQSKKASLEFFLKPPHALTSLFRLVHRQGPRC